jgi:hypothetical protein
MLHQHYYNGSSTGTILFFYSYSSFVFFSLNYYYNLIIYYISKIKKITTLFIYLFPIK